MPVLKRRNRLVNFRLTEQEYLELKEACSAQGGRCLSEFARTAAFGLARSQALLEGSTQEQLLTLDRKLSDLGSHVGRVLELLQDISGRDPVGEAAGDTGN